MNLQPKTVRTLTARLCALTARQRDYIFTDLDQPHVCPWVTLKSHDVIVYILKIGKQKPQNDYALASRLTTLAARPRATTSRLRALAARPIMFDP